MDRLYRPELLTWREETTPRGFVFVTVPNRWRGAFLALLAVLWNGIVLAAVVGTRGGAFPFVTLHFAAGVFVALQAWRALCGSTQITIDCDGFALRQVRAPGLTRREYLDNVVGFDVTQGSPSMWSSSTWQRVPVSYVRLLTRDGRAVRLALPRHEPEEALFMAARLNAALRELRAPLGYRDERALPPAA